MVLLLLSRDNIAYVIMASVLFALAVTDADHKIVNSLIGIIANVCSSA